MENLLFPRSDLYGRAGRAWLAVTPLSPELRSQADRLLRVHDVLTGEIHQLDEEVKRLRRDHPMIERLHTIAGVGLFGALFLVAEIGAIERFASSHQLAAYAGLVASTRSSGGKTNDHMRLVQGLWVLALLPTVVESQAPAGRRPR